MEDEDFTDLSFMDRSNHILNLLTSTPIARPKLHLPLNGTSSSAYQTALSSAFEEFITPDSSLLNPEDWLPPASEDRVKETPMAAKVPKKKGRPPKAKATENIVPTDHNYNNEPNYPTTSKAEKIPEAIITSPSSEQKQLETNETEVTHDPKIAVGESAHETNSADSEPAETPSGTDVVRTLRKRTVKKILLPKKRGRAKAVDNENENDASEPQPEVFVPQVEIPESGLIYHDGLVWEDKPPPPVPCGTANGILKIGIKRNHVDAALEADPEHVESPLKKSRFSISFLEEPHVRFYHSPTLLKKRRPVKKGRKKKKINLPEEVVDEALSVEVGSNVEINSDEACVHESEEVDMNENNLKVPSTPNTDEHSFVENAQNIYENSNNAMDCPDPVVATNSTKDAPKCSDAVPTFGTQKDLRAEESGNFNFSFSLSVGNGVIENPNTSVSMGFEVQNELEAISEEKESMEIESPRTSLIQISELQPMPMEEESSAEFFNSENGNYSTEPVCPTLVDSKEPVSAIIPKLTHQSMSKALENIFESCGVNTIGDLSRKTHGDLINWPINQPRYQTVVSVLLEYSIASKQQTNPNLNVKGNAVKKSSISMADKLGDLLSKPILHNLGQMQTVVAEENNKKPNSGTSTSQPSKENFPNTPSPNFDSLSVVGNLVEFLDSPSSSSSNFLEALLSRDSVGEKILKQLANRDDFFSRYWSIARKEPHGNKSAKSFCDFLMSKEVTKMYRQKFGGKIPDEIPANFWKSILTNLQDCYLHTFNQNGTFVPEEINMKVSESDLNLSSNSTFTNSLNQNFSEIEERHDKTLLYFSRSVLQQIENKAELQTVESIENKYATKLQELNFTLQNLKSELKDEGPQSADSPLSQELLNTTLSLVESMDQGLLSKFLLKLVHREGEK